MWFNDESDFRLHDDDEDELILNDNYNAKPIQVDNEGVVWDLSVYKENGKKTVLQYIKEIKKTWNENIFIWISGAKLEQKEDKRKWKLKGIKYASKKEIKQKKAQEVEPKEYEKLTALKKVKKFYKREIKGALIVTNEHWKYYDISVK